jgi:hypothetical protein
LATISSNSIAASIPINSISSRQFTFLTTKSWIQESLASSSSKSEYKKKLQKALYEISSSHEDEFANENPDYGPNLLSYTHTYIRIF